MVISRGKGIVYRLSNIISLPEFIIYTSDPLRKNNRRNFLREKLQTVFRRKKESSRKFLADECETACTRFDAWKEAGYTRTNVQLYTNPRKRRYRERERERKERDAVSERRPRASRPSPLYRRPRRSHLSSSPRFTTSLLGHVCESPRYVFDLCAHLLALNAGGEGNRFRTD